MSVQDILQQGLLLEQNASPMDALKYYMQSNEKHPAVLLRLGYLAQKIQQYDFASKMHTVVASNPATAPYTDLAAMAALPPQTILIAGYQFWYPFEHHILLNHLDKEQYRLIELATHAVPASIPDLTPQNAKDYKHRGLSLFDMTTYEACIALELDHPNDIDPLQPEHWAILEPALLRMATLTDYYTVYFNFYQPALVIYPQGYMPAAAVARNLAIIRNIPTLAIENICDPTRLMCETRTGISVTHNSVAAIFGEHLDDITTDIAEEAWQNYVSNIKSRKHQEHQTPDTALVIPKENPKQKMILYMAQVGTDSSILYGSPYFTSQVDIMLKAAKTVLAQGHYCVIKLHPKEHAGNRPVDNLPYHQLTLRKLKLHPDFAALQDNPHLIIDADNQYDSYNLISQADACITINSQLGLEAACIGKPVIICGECTYGGVGFTHDVKSDADLKTMIETALSDQGLSTDTILARRFFYSYLNYSAIEHKIEQFTAVIKKTALPATV